MPSQSWPRLVLLAPACLLLGGCMMPNHEQQVAANEVYLKQEGIVALAVGTQAPALTGVVEASNEPAALPTLGTAHAHGLVLFFVPALDTPNTERNLLDLQKRQAALEAGGVGVYAVVQGSADAAATLKQQLGLGFGVLADPTGAAAKAYGCLAAAGTYPQRTTVGINHEGAIALYARGLADATSVDKAFGLTPPAK